jgi:hypothetical protein
VDKEKHHQLYDNKGPNELGARAPALALDVTISALHVAGNTLIDTSLSTSRPRLSSQSSHFLLLH